MLRKQGMLRKWEKDLKRNEEEMQIAIGVLEEKRMALNRTVDMLVRDLVELITESIEELNGDKSEMAFGQRLAYVECLEMIKGEIAGSEEEFGLDGDLDKKFGLI